MNMTRLARDYGPVLASAAAVVALVQGLLSWQGLVLVLVGSIAVAIVAFLRRRNQKRKQQETKDD